MDFMDMFRKKEEDQTLERTLMLLTGVGVGVGLMYLLDPSMGRRRRAMIRDSASSAAHQVGESVSGAWDDVSHRAQGLMHETKGMVSVASSSFRLWKAIVESETYSSPRVRWIPAMLVSRSASE